METSSKLPKGKNLSNMSEEDLKEIGFTRMKIPRSTAFKVVSSDLLCESKGNCAAILRKHPNYLYSLDRERMYNTLRNEDLINLTDIRSTWGRINNLIKSGVPPLWEEEFEGKSDIQLTYEADDGALKTRAYKRFPTVDFILQFGSGSYFDRRKWRGGLMEEGVLSGIGRANLQDIKKFRTYAMPEGKINSTLEREIVYWLNNKFHLGKRKERSMENTLEALHSIEEKLKEFPMEDPEYEIWDGKDISVVRDPVWYLFYGEKDKEGILERYVENALDQDSKYFFGRSSARLIYDRLNYLFSLNIDLFEKQERIDETLFLRMIEQEDFSDMPYEMLVENKYGFEREILYTHIEDRFQLLQEEDPTFMFKTKQKLRADLKISPTSYLKDNGIRMLIEGLRVKYLTESSDDFISEVYENKPKIKGGHASSVYVSEFSRLFISRLNDLGY